MDIVIRRPLFRGATRLRRKSFICLLYPCIPSILCPLLLFLSFLLPVGSWYRRPGVSFYLLRPRFLQLLGGSEIHQKIICFRRVSLVPPGWAF